MDASDVVGTVGAVDTNDLPGMWDAWPERRGRKRERDGQPRPRIRDEREGAFERQARVIGRMIAFRRLALGLTQAQLADQIGSSPSAISRIERGHHRVSLYTLNRIAWAMRWQVVIGFFDWTLEFPFRELVGANPYSGTYDDLKAIPFSHPMRWPPSPAS